MKKGRRIPYKETNSVRILVIEYEFRSYIGLTRVCKRSDFMEKTETSSKLIKYAINKTRNDKVTKTKYLFLIKSAYTNVVVRRRTEIIRSENTVINIRQNIEMYDSIN